MAKAIDLLVKKEYVSEADTDEEKTIWLLNTLSGLQFMQCTSNGFVDHEMIIRLGLSGWLNFHDFAGNEIEFSAENINRIPALILQDISFEIQGMSGLMGEERKN